MADTIKRVQEMIKALSSKGKGPGGITALVQMLQHSDRETEKQILNAIDSQYPDLAEKLRKAYFTFEDLVQMEDNVLKRALEEVHRTTLAVALKGTSQTLQDKVFHNLSARGVKLLQEDMEFMGPKPRSLVEEAQREVTKTLRKWRNVIL
jgi:flagellar motor switch protein FliG